MPLILAPENVELTIIKVLLDDKLKKERDKNARK